MRRTTGPNESKIVLPITPMLDMTFQLLFFFITSFNPADQEGQIEMALPSEVIKATDKPDPQAAPDLCEQGLRLRRLVQVASV